MGCTTREAMARVDAAEFAGWLAYWEIEPPVATRVDLNAAHLVTAVLAAGGARPGKLSEYVLRYGGEAPRRAQSAEEMEAICRALAGMGGARKGGARRGTAGPPK
jgi:hypothetical protein